MQIERVDMHHLRMPLVSHFETSFGRVNTRDCILIQVYADGLCGIGECVSDYMPGYSYETVGTAWHILKDFLIPAIMAPNFESPASFQRAVSSVRGHNLAKAGLEMALWDLWGKSVGRSLQDMIQGVHARVEVGVSVGIQDTAIELAKTVEGYLSKGYTRVKIKIKPGRDVADTQALRQVFPDLRLQVDANSAYTLETAEALLPLDQVDLLMIEQPLAEDDLWDHRLLQKKFITPLCLDESILSPRHARQALEMKACRIVNIKLGRVGGLSQAIAIHNLCQAQQVPVWCGGMLETGVGRAANLALASLPGFSLPGDISATERYYSEDITEQRFVLNPDSTIDVPRGPGIGVTLNNRVLNRVTQAKLSLP
jgi:O-succinylbenzoate synthase